MFWSDLFYMVLSTTFTGSILTVAWFVTSYLLEKTGYLNLAYRLSKVVVLFWIIPVVYLVVMAADKIGFLWNGYAFEVTPVIIKNNKRYGCILDSWTTIRNIHICT